MTDLRNINQRVRIKFDDWYTNWRLLRLNRQISRHAKLHADQSPVAFFNASTRLVGLSLNAAFSYLAACGLLSAGVPVVNFACKAGMSSCVLGSDRENPSKEPPCQACISQAKWIFSNAPAIWFEYIEDENLKSDLKALNIEELCHFDYEISIDLNERMKPDCTGDISPVPLGQLVLPSLRWFLRRHHLLDNENTRFFFRKFILSAYRVAVEFHHFLHVVQPQAVIVFNGLMFPEATARWVARKHGIRVITHEVGFQPFSAFFTDGDATAYPIDIPGEFELNPDQNAQLDEYLEQRFRGDFTMAGIRFWSHMESLSETLTQRMQNFRQIVPIFTNVVFDTSQVHANTIFEDMFAWLDKNLEIIREHKDTFFIIRSHLDEMRPGKESQETVKDWVINNHLEDYENVLFVKPQAYLSSYELIQKAKFVMVYNSSIGLEAALLGAPVICGGKARYTQIPTVFVPKTQASYQEMAEEFLNSPNSVPVPDDFRKNARKFLYYQLYRASLSFSDFLEDSSRPGFVKIKPLSWRQLSIERSPTMRAIVEGITQGKPFLMENN
jgi:hypothetical protein